MDSNSIYQNRDLATSTFQKMIYFHLKINFVLLNKLFRIFFLVEIFRSFVTIVAIDRNGISFQVRIDRSNDPILYLIDLLKKDLDGLGF
jgi:hypothetical protein